MFAIVWKIQAKRLIYISCIKISSGFLPIILALITREIFNLLVIALTEDSDAHFQQLLLLLGLNILILLGQQILLQMEVFLVRDINRKINLYVQNEVYGKLIQLQGLAYFENPAFYDTIRFAIEGSQRGPGEMFNTLLSMITNLITLISWIGVILVFGPVLLLFIGLSLIPEIILRVRSSNLRFELSLETAFQQRQISYFSMVASNVTFVKAIQTLNIGRYIVDKILSITENVQQTEREYELKEIRYELLSQGIIILYKATAHIFVILQAFAQQITIGDVTLYLSALGSIRNTSSGLASSIINIHQTTRYFQYYENLMNLPPILSTNDNPLPVAPLQDAIKFKNVSFRYSDEHPWVLRHFNLTIPARSCTGIVGLNGSGKTTFVKLLLRLYDPCEGQILWDGVDIRTFNVQAYREHIGVLFQDFEKFDLTVQENIGVGNISEIDNMSHIIAAAQKADVHNLINNFPETYQTILSRWLLTDDDTGLELSGGQWQKIAMARLFMRDESVFILDEPTSAMDAEAEYESYQRLSQLKTDHTLLLISHRFSTMRVADQIAVLKNGQIIEYGNHTELLNNQGLYNHLHSMQVN